MTDEVYSGQVIERTVNRGSKSEYRAAFLESGSRVLRLWRPAGPSFHDPVLMRLVGSTIRCRGRIEGGKLILSSWRKVKPKAP
jgi:hypothetical protein